MFDVCLTGKESDPHSDWARVSKLFRLLICHACEFIGSGINASVMFFNIKYIFKIS